MLVYHGSNIEVKEPMMLPKYRALDFGGGFYTTMNKNQAERFTFGVLKRNKGQGIPTISIYEVDLDSEQDLRILKFDSANAEWFDFVEKNRMDSNYGHKYDIVIGPVANDTVADVFRTYELGIISREIAIQQLRVRKLFNQVVFCSKKALSMLEFAGSEVVDK